MLKTVLSFLVVLWVYLIICSCSHSYGPAGGPAQKAPTKGNHEASQKEGKTVPWQEFEDAFIQYDKMALWSGKTQLRGANIFQREVHPELDGPEFMGLGHVGPPYIQSGFDRLSELGANLVVVSHPGLFDVKAPYMLNKHFQENPDALLGMISKADMFAVIAFRTGPGRSEFTFYLDEVGDWFNKSYLDDTVWENQEAQNAWVDM
jgi:hypothetical protein